MTTLGKPLLPLLPEGSGRVIIDAPKWELSQRAKDEIEEIESNRRRAAILARDFIFD
jgi:hypothetical protein